jgi:Family of unknown function (DUF6496)
LLSGVRQLALKSKAVQNDDGLEPQAQEVRMPEEKTIERAQRDKEEGKSPSTQAGEFIREEMHHIREGKHGARWQAIAIGLSKARRAGVELPPPKSGTSAKTKAQAQRDTQKGKASPDRKPSRLRSDATLSAFKREPRSAASRANFSKHSRAVAKKRGSLARHQSANASGANQSVRKAPRKVAGFKNREAG